MRTGTIIRQSGIPIVAISVIAALASGCASTRAYFGDRGRDAADIASVAVGKGIGLKARVSFVALGLLRDESIAGLRGGSLYSGRPGDYCFDMQFFANVNEFFAPPDSDIRSKRYRAKLTIGLVDGFMDVGSGANAYWCLVPPVCLAPMLPVPPDVTPRALPYYTQVEVVGGLGLTLRLGLNPGEVVDFVLGWVGVDFMKDDVRMRWLREERTTE